MSCTGARALILLFALSPWALRGQEPRMQLTASRAATVPSQEVSLVTGCHGPWLALGDRVQCQPVRRRCVSDTCSDYWIFRQTDLDSLRWVSSDESVLQVKKGLIQAVGTGRARVTVFLRDSAGSTDFTVLPPVAAIRFERPLHAMRVGDTVRIRAWAYDSTGKPVRLMLPDGYQGGEVWPLRPVPTRDQATAGELIRAMRVGQTYAFTTMAHRRDSTKIVVHP